MWKRKILIIIALRFAAILCVVYVLLAMADHEIIDLTLEVYVRGITYVNIWQTIRFKSVLILYLQLEYLREMKLSWEQCADILLVSRTTLWRRCREMGLHLNSQYSDISVQELDAIVQRLACDLRSMNIIVPRRMVRESLVQQRATTTVSRRTYSVPSDCTAL